MSFDLVTQPATAIPSKPPATVTTITQVYGTTIKALIHEEFGHGVMSAINFDMDIELVEDSDGDRVRVAYEGKYLPYQWKG